MRILHTSDWHAGKTLGRNISRHGELRACIGEMVDLVEEHNVDMVLVAGDLFDKQTNVPAACVGLVLDGLSDLAAGGKVPVVAIAGNHDSGEWFENMARTMTPHGVHLVGSVRPQPRPWTSCRDGVPLVTVETRGGEPAVVAAVPFLREQQLFDAFDVTPGTERGAYAENMRRLCAQYSEAAIDEAALRDGRSFLMGHFLISGSRVLGGGMPRGEKVLHMSDAYAAGESAVNTGVDYVALGHVHNPQPLPGLYAPGEYAGSPIQMDFGERGEDKRVVVHDTDTQTTTSVPLLSGRPLAKVDMAWEQPIPDDTLGCYTDVTVECPDGVSTVEVREWATATWPKLVRVRTVRETPHEADTDQPDGQTRPALATAGNLSVTEQYRNYWKAIRGADPSERILRAVRDLETETSDT